LLTLVFSFDLKFENPAFEKSTGFSRDLLVSIKQGYKEKEAFYTFQVLSLP